MSVVFVFALWARSTTSSLRFFLAFCGAVFNGAVNLSWAFGKYVAETQPAGLVSAAGCLAAFLTARPAEVEHFTGDSLSKIASRASVVDETVRCKDCRTALHESLSENLSVSDLDF
jgi:hypothetical protein